MKTKHEMPVLSEQEREELQRYIESCVANKTIMISIRDSLRLDALRDRIALAALTDEPACFGTMQEDWPDEDRDLFLDKAAADFYAENCYELMPLYTSPPVPTMKPVKLPEPDLVYSTATDTYGDEGCMMIPVCSAVKAIKAAGGTVEGDIENTTY